MKILFISHRFYPYMGGIEVNSEILATRFFEEGYAVRLMTWTEDQSEKEFPFEVIRNPSTFILFKQHRWADVVFENNPCLRLSWPGIFFNKPSVVALRTWVCRIHGHIGWQDRLKLLWLRRATEVIAVSNSVRVRTWMPATVIENPYRLNLFKILPEISRNRAFVFLGRLVSDKGADLAIKALYALINQKKYVHVKSYPLSLTIIGDGPERKSLEQLVLQLGMEDRVIFKGSLSGESLVFWLNKHHYMLVPSMWEEPFGNVALEGMACGCLPIVSEGGGLPEAIGDAGLTFQRGSVEALADCIQNLLDNPLLEKKLRDAAPHHLDAHRPTTISQRYLKVIHKACRTNQAL